MGRNPRVVFLDEIDQTLHGFFFRDIKLHRFFPNVEVNLAGSAAHITKVGIGHFAGAIYDAQRLEVTCKDIYRCLHLNGYARIDLRLTAGKEIIFIEANPNPMLARDEDFAMSAKKAGLGYPK